MPSTGQGGGTQGDGGTPLPVTSRPPENLLRDPVLSKARRVHFLGDDRPVVARIPLVAKLGEGAAGVVYLGWHPFLRHEVAVKLLKAAALKDDGLRRFLREARLSVRLRSEHLVTTYDVGLDDATGSHYLTMEFVSGASADAWAERVHQTGPVAERDALDLLIAASKGLAVAHREGVIHRDFKPANVFVPRDAQRRPQPTHAKLGDLGLARSLGDDRRLTQLGDMMGTPGFMPPEQFGNAAQADKPSDVHAVGASLYQLLANRCPYQGKDLIGFLTATQSGRYPALRSLRPDVSPATEEITSICLQTAPSERFPDAPALVRALEAARAGLEGRTRSEQVRHTLHTLQCVRPEGRPVERTSPDPAASDRRPRPPLEDPPQPPGTDAPAGRPAQPSAGAGPAGPHPPRGGTRSIAVAATVIAAVGACALAAALFLGGRKGTLSVASRAAGSEVFVDHVSAGPAPVIGLQVSAGDHEIEVRAPACEPWKGREHVTAGKSVDLGAVTPPPWGTVDLSEIGTGATAWRDGQELEDGAGVPPVKTRIELRRPRHAPQACDVYVPLGVRRKVEPKPWDALQARLDLTGLPPGATATADGEPVSGIAGFPEARTVVVTIQAPGRSPETRKVAVRLGETVPLGPVAFSDLPAQVVLPALPPGTVARIGSRTVSGTVAVAAGTHSVRLARIGWQPRKFVVTLTAGATERIDPGNWDRLSAPAAEVRQILQDLALWDEATSSLRGQAAADVAARAKGFRFAEMRNFNCGGVQREVAVFRHEATGLEFALVPGGVFAMGSPETETARLADESRHDVELTRPFLIATTEMTQAAWTRIGGTNASRAKGPDRPVENVSWDDATACLAAAGLALPTEAQWEHACRAGGAAAYTTGETQDSLRGFANLMTRGGFEDAWDGTAPVTALAPNALGLLGVHGNVAEWCADVHLPYGGDAADPLATGDASADRVFRGGSWNAGPRLARCASRGHGSPRRGADDVGLRPCLTIDIE